MGKLSSVFFGGRTASMNILIIKTSSFGDIVHGLQMADSLRAQLARAGKSCTITWLVQDRFAGLVEASGIAGERLIYSRRKGFFGGQGLRSALRSRRFDIVLDLQGRWKTGYWSRLPRADRRIGRADARELAGLFYLEKPALPPGGRYGSHAIDILLRFLPLLGCEATLAGPLGFPGSPAPAIDPAVLARRPILIFPDSAQAVKEWPGFRELTRELANDYPAVPVLWPGWSDMVAPSGLRHDNFHNLMKQVPLQALPNLVGRARLVIANDSGPMHLAAAMGVPVVGIFGPSSVVRYGPWPLTAGQTRAIRAPESKLAKLPVGTVRAEITACLARMAECRLDSP
jgi:ADP-heptose:LPS heptosyltransferase